MNAWKMNGVDFVQFNLSIEALQLGSYYSNSSKKIKLIHVKVFRHFYKCKSHMAQTALQRALLRKTYYILDTRATSMT